MTDAICQILLAIWMWAEALAARRECKRQERRGA